MLLPPPEKLTSRRDSAGVWHAHYPSARRTLCGELLSEQRPIGRRWDPTCPVCVEQALLMHRIDYSMPRHWRLWTMRKPAAA